MEDRRFMSEQYPSARDDFAQDCSDRHDDEKEKAMFSRRDVLATAAAGVAMSTTAAAAASVGNPDEPARLVDAPRRTWGFEIRGAGATHLYCELSRGVFDPCDDLEVSAG
jgi:hypothetical protein